MKRNSILSTFLLPPAGARIDTAALSQFFSHTALSMTSSGKALSLNTRRFTYAYYGASKSITAVH